MHIHLEERQQGALRVSAHLQCFSPRTKYSAHGDTAARAHVKKSSLSILENLKAGEP